MENANTWVHPTRFTGEYPQGFAGYTFLDYDKNYNTYHPGEDYNFGIDGFADLGQSVVASSSGVVIYASEGKTGYGNMVVIKHVLGYNIKRFIKETYNIDTNELYSLYGHLQKIEIKNGDILTTGKQIGRVGNSGTSYPHLHFEIYAPIGDLLKTNFRYYPNVKDGWTKEKTQQYYLPAYKFIEATKQLSDIIDSFLGKSKDYWMQVEKDREALLLQLSEKEKDWAKKLEVEELLYKKQIGELEQQVIKAMEKKNTAVDEAERLTDRFTKLEQDYKNQIYTLQIQNSKLIENNADNYKFWDAVKLAIKVGSKKLGFLK